MRRSLPLLLTLALLVAPAVRASTAPRFVDSFSRQGQEAEHAVTIGPSTTVVTIVCRWKKSASRFDVVDLELVPKGRYLSAATKLKITRSRTATSITARVERLKPGKLAFGIRATRLAGGAGKATTTVRRG